MKERVKVAEERDRPDEKGGEGRGGEGRGRWREEAAMARYAVRAA